MSYGDFKDWSRRTFDDKLLRDKAFNIAKDPKYDGYQRGLTSIINNYLDKKASVCGTKSENISNKELAKEFHKPIIRKFNTRKVDSRFRDDIWGADLVDMQINK